MGRSVSKSTLGTWLTKKAWLSLAAVVVGLLAASIGMSLLGNSVVSAHVEQRSRDHFPRTSKISDSGSEWEMASNCLSMAQEAGTYKLGCR